MSEAHDASGEADKAPGDEIPYIVWSEEHSAWWTPTRFGYTNSILAAGRFTKEAAKEIEEKANRYLPKDVLFREVAMPDPLWGRLFLMRGEQE